MTLQVVLETVAKRATVLIAAVVLVANPYMSYTEGDKFIISLIAGWMLLWSFPTLFAEIIEWTYEFFRKRKQDALDKEFGIKRSP